MPHKTCTCNCLKIDHFDGDNYTFCHNCNCPFYTEQTYANTISNGILVGHAACPQEQRLKTETLIQ